MPCPTDALRAAGPVQDARFPIPQALALGALHGPTELLPVSSSGHVTAVPWLLGWRYCELDHETRKSFEVALHAGSAAAWLLLPTTTGGPSPVSRDPRQLLLLALAVAPAGVTGLIFERPIERRLGTPALIAAGLAAGAVAMAVADGAPEVRDTVEARPADALWLGVAQAAALLPGVSRTGATLAAARVRGFKAPAAWRLSTGVATPVIGGAAALKLARLLSRRPSKAQTARLLAGGAASFASTVLAGQLLRPAERGWPLKPFAAYRMVLALVLAARLRRSRRGSRAHSRRSAQG
jgi:undecaprenyl-diphosphatase